jgi:hypothetical protein
MAAFVELFMDQGSTFNNSINLTDDVTNAALNIASYSFSSQMRRSYYSANASANLVCTITNGANGELTMSLSAANTANLRPGRYVFDVQSTDAYNVVSRVVEGIITVTPRVAR